MVSLLSIAAWCGFVAVIVWLVIRVLRWRLGERTRSGRDWLSIAFLHPYCNAGGGGERVLWAALLSLEDLELPGVNLEFVIYSGDADISPEQTFQHVKDRFGIEYSEDLKSSVKFVHLKKRGLVEADRYPRFTMLGQSLGSMLMTWEALRAYNPDVFIDTTGFAFSYLLAKGVAQCRVIAYTHYPTITADMLKRVHERRPTYNNASDVSSSWLRTTAKVIYYNVFARLYAFAGKYVDVVMANSSWTQAHLQKLWGKQPVVVFPPCNTAALQTLPLNIAEASDDDDDDDGDDDDGEAAAADSDGSEDSAAGAGAGAGSGAVAGAAASEQAGARRERTILSIGQFRPEKDHQLQLRAFALLHKRAECKDVKLRLVGGCRGDEDEARVAKLKELAKELDIEDGVEFLTNVPFSKLKELLGSSRAGLHTMWNEHFGIGIVEMMAAGVLPVAHASGGPKSDIVVPFKGQDTGFLATTPEEYAKALQKALNCSESEHAAMQVAARASVDRFSDESFETAFFAACIRVIHDAERAKKALL